MNQFVAAFDQWIRSSFVEMNTELEGLYFAQEDRSETGMAGNSIKQTLVEEGRAYIIDLLAEGNTDEGFDQAFDLLGNVGLYMAACRRHDITEPSRETRSPLVEASALAMPRNPGINAMRACSWRFAPRTGRPQHSTTINWSANLSSNPQPISPKPT